MDERATGARRLTAGDRRFPNELRALEAAPQELWLRGRMELLAPGPRAAVVGTRSPTPYGLAQARRFTLACVERGVVIVSGLARGIDEAAHRAALEIGGGTIAVLGSGVDRPWPEGDLAERIACDGLLLSEFPLGTGPRRHHFPLRNRLISGLAGAVLVVEAARASGSLITARWAADQGRAVCAVPGRVDQPMARGCHRLIREGARLVEDPAEVLEELGLAASPEPERNPAAGEPLDGAMITLLCGETATAEELALRAGRPISEVLARLVGLELAGTVVRAPGGLYRLAVRNG
jgi:DNA processing protein